MVHGEKIRKVFCVAVEEPCVEQLETIALDQTIDHKFNRVHAFGSSKFGNRNTVVLAVVRREPGTEWIDVVRVVPHAFFFSFFDKFCPNACIA